MKNEKIIFFDGYCGLCNGFVDFVLKHDRHQVFKFSPLQSDFAQANLPPEYVQDLSSVVVSIDGHHFRKSKAVFAVFNYLGPGWKLLFPFGFLPAPVLNYGYDLVAKNRYRFFGKRETCRLPSPQERSRFIL
jgi:predicted DCC family thiol-disulfide oxidoreductase YuxK